MRPAYSDLLEVIRGLRSSDRGITFVSRHDEAYLSYSELYNQALGFLEALQRKGMKPKDELLFQLDDNRCFLVVFWACILGGIIPVPVTSGNNEEHRLKLQRVWHVLNKPYLVTTQQTFEQIEKFAALNDSFISLESMRQNLIIIDELVEWDGVGIPHTVLPDDIALIQFSSGSTGDPKGVTLTHRNILCNINAIINGTNITDTDSSLSWMPLTHDMGLIGFHLATMTANIHQYMMPPALFILAPELWLDIAHDHQVTFLSSPNFGYKHFLNHYKANAARQWDLSHVKLLFNGAEPISMELSEQFLDAMEPHGMSRNVMFPVYGMAEASLAVTFPPIDESLIPVFLDRSHLLIGEAIREIESWKDECVTFVDVGYPVKDCSIRICDDDRTNLAEGYVGNIYIKGNNVTQGYYNNPQATNNLLTEDGWLNTGDLGFIRGGRLVITGRKKDIIFIRGQNYYPHDLEAIAQTIPGIELGKVAVCGVSGGAGGLEEIAAFVLFRGKLEKFIDQIIQLKKVFNKSTGLELAHVIPVRNIPKTTSGKLQRYKLADQYKRREFTSVIEQINSLIDRHIRQSEVVLPENPLEQQLLELWMEVLGQRQISVHDHFFELGGDSLKAALLLNRIHRQFQIEIPVNAMYEISTIRLIADYLISAEKSEYTPIPNADRQNYYPLSPAQYRVYIQEQFDGIGISYNMPMVMHIEGKLDLSKVKNAFQQLVDYHEILRTSFVEVEGAIVQVVHDNQVIELNELVIDNEVNGLQAAIDRFIRPFDLGNAPLLRVGIITQSSQQNYHLILDMHHIISDGISVKQITDQFAKLYDGDLLPEHSLQYKDYVMWQQAVMDEDRHNQRQYWQNQLSAEIPILEMPTDYKRVDQRSFSGDKVQFLIPEEMVKRLNDVARQKNVTLNTLIVSIYAIVLSKYTRQQQLIIGSLTSGRNHAELASVLGMFINYIPLRIEVEPTYTYSEYLEHISNMMLSAYSHQDYPYESMIADLPVRTPQGRNPIFDTMVIVHNQMDVGEVKQVGNLKITFEEWSTNTSKLDFKLDVYVDNAKGLVCKLEYNTQLFKRETIQRLTEHYIAVMDAVLHNPQACIGHIELLLSEERDQILGQFNKPMLTLRQKGNVTHQWFEAAAAQHPDQIAVMFGDRRMTYRELNEKSNQLARVLNKHGLAANRIAAIILDRSMEMMISILAIMKAGGAYLPISPDYPIDRQRYMLADSESILVLTQGQWMDVIEFDGIILNVEDESLFHGDSANLSLSIQPEHLAYVIYTSGSTGNPKGVMIEHAGVVNRIEWMHEQYPISSKDVILQKTAFTFDVSVWELLWWSLAGATVSFLSPGGEKDPEKIMQTIEEHQVTTLHFVPSMLHLFLAHVERHTSGERVIERLASLRYVFASGEALPVQQVERFYKLFDSSRTTLINLYGPTEASIDVSYYDCVAGEQLESVPIGKPIKNTQLYIVDEQFHLLPIGVPGELCIAGVGLARGYIGLPELNADKFIDNPFVPGARMYRTGDLARWLPDGSICYMGRLDHQVKLRGYRIELGEIEAGLLRHTHIGEAVVLVKEATDGDQYLAAYIVTTDDISVSDIRQHLRTMMPEYMIPAQYHQLEAMPLTSNSKVDRKALAKLESNVYVNDIYVAPHNELEVKLTVIWCAVLHLERVGTTDHFFEIGGHSLKATEMLHLIHKELGVSIPLRAIFTHPTIQALASFIMDHNQVSTFQSIQPAQPAAHYPLSPAQSRLYVLHQFDGIGTAYHLPVTLVCQGIIDPRRFEQAMRQVIHRHESLRTTFDLVDGIPVQRIHSQVSFDVQHWTDKHISLTQIIQEFIRPFDLTKAPQLRAGIVQQSDDQQFILFDMHHIISDGMSMGIVVNDFIRFYEGQQLENLALQYKDFAVWQLDFMKSEALKGQEQFWLNTFVDPLPVLNFPTDFNRRPLRSFEGDKVTFVMDEQLTRALRLLAAETESTLYMVLLAVFNIVLSRYSGQDDIIVGTPVSGRPHADLYSIIGMFVNTIPLRNRPTADRTFKQFMHELRDNTLSAFDNQHYPFEELVGKLQLNRNLSRNPLFDVMFVMQNMNIPELTMDGSLMKLHEFQHSSSKFDFTLEVMETNNGLSCHFEYCTKLFYKETVERWVQHYLHVIKEVLANPDIVLGDIQMISQEESITLVSGSHGKETNYPHNTTLHQLFEEQVARTPDRIAVVFEDEQWTYRELNARANRIAHLLRSKGVTRDQPVGLMIDRSLDMVVSMLAILKAGGAYVPMDPAYPADRIQYMIENSAVRLVLAESEYVHVLRLHAAIEIIDLSQLPNLPADNLTSINEIDDLAYIIYTSGTTGKPKGVMIEHRNVIRLLINDNSAYDFNDQDVWTMFHSFCFDISVWEMYGALLYGGKLVVFSKQTAQDPQQFLDLMIKERVTILNQTPSAFYPLIPYEVGRSKCELQLRYVIFGGEALKPAMLKPWKQRYPNTHLINMYGITETTVHSTFKEITLIEIEENVSNIGVPIPTLSCYIVNEQMKLLPRGVIGELYVGGDGVARGYMDNELLTFERFVSNPFIPEQRLYRSGDLAKWLPNGELEYHGRIDHQVKIRGFRIELSEIENSLLRHPEITASVVLVKESNDGDKQLWAYVETDNKLTIPDIRKHLSDILPDYMVPAFYVQLDEIPLTVNGKVDRNALLRLEGSIRTNSEFTAPGNELEQKLTVIWRQLLGLEEISIHDHFFEIGGHSLLLIRMHHQLEAEFPGIVKVTDLFAYTTIHKLGAFIEAETSLSTSLVDVPSVQLPQSFFVTRQEQQSSASFQLLLDSDLASAVRRIASSLNSELDPILAIVYVYVLAQFTKKAQHSISLMTQDQRVHVLDIHLGGELDMPKLVQSIRDTINDRKNSGVGVLIRDQIKSMPMSMNDSMYPLLYNNNQSSIYPNLNESYDLLISYRADHKQITLYCDFHGRRLRKEKVREFFQGYVKLLRLLCEQLSNSQETAAGTRGAIHE